MYYKFQCPKCEHIEELDIPMEKYFELKDKQFCVLCRSKLERVIEWKGIAEGSGEGWFGNSKGGGVI